MAESIGNLYDDDVVDDVIQQQDSQIVETTKITDEPVNNEPNGDENDSGLNRYLYSMGIKDPTKIKFDEDENGNVQEKDWNSLTPEEQYNILDSSREAPEEGLSEDEIDFINTVRESRMSPKQYLNAVIEQSKPKEQPAPRQKIDFDNMDDDYLFVTDLSTKLGENASKDYLKTMLEAAKADPDNYKKQVEGIRNYYKEAQEFEIKQAEENQKREQEQKFNEFKESIINAVNNIDSIGDFDIKLDASDKSEIADLILTKDDAGVSWLAKVVSDPNELTKLAFYYLYGDKLIDDIQKETASKITAAKSAGYLQGINKNKPTVTIKNNNNSNNNNPNKSKVTTLNDLYG